jgi:putative phosphonate metabolism protein
VGTPQENDPMSTDTGTDSDYGPMDTRYAVYYAPPSGSALKRLADAWLGRDPDRDERVSFPVVEGLTPERLQEVTASPRHYGFHATMKAPFALADGMEAAGLLGDVEAFAMNRRPVRVRLEVGELGGFLALVPAEPSAALDRLAADCVREFDSFRAPLSDEERRRRGGDQLSEAERANLEQWGYPYVFEQFRFHMTLTGPLEDPERGRVKAILEHAFGPYLGEPVVIDQLALFTQTHHVAPFRVVGRFPFRG